MHLLEIGGTEMRPKDVVALLILTLFFIGMITWVEVTTP
jgi:hypothetical protein